MISLLGSLLRQSAIRYPKRIAIEDKKKGISYKELDVESDVIAFYLLSEGLKIGGRVGLCTHKSMGGIKTAFGILKAGGVYVPLDPKWPPKRSAFIIDDCQIEYLFINSSYVDSLQEVLKFSSSLKCVIFLDNPLEPSSRLLPKSLNIRFLEKIKKTPIRKFPSLKPDSIVSILYTSGSTDQPKGVVMTQQAVMEDLIRTLQLYRLIKKDRYALYFPFSFSPSLYDVFLMVKIGATVCVLPEGTTAFIPSVKAFLKENKITFLRIDPKFLINLTLHGAFKRGELPYLKTVISNGSKLPLKYAHSFMDLIPKAKLYNEYASTEALLVTSYLVKKGRASQKEIYLPIGKPARGVKTFLVDESGNRLAQIEGDEGELYVSSLSLMSGYWNDPETTKDVLFKKPFTKGYRTVYRTHDIMRIGRNKDYIFLGRSDNIIKTRGYRVSLDEIESVLESHPAIKEAVVLGVPDEEIENRIKAVVVLKEEHLLNEETIKGFCRDYLAIYMIPEIIEFRSSLPRTSSGKINRQALLKA